MVPKCCQTNKFADSSLDFEYRKENNKEITITCENQRPRGTGNEKQILQSSISESKSEQQIE